MSNDQQIQHLIDRINRYTLCINDIKLGTVCVAELKKSIINVGINTLCISYLDLDYLFEEPVFEWLYTGSNVDNETIENNLNLCRQKINNLTQFETTKKRLEQLYVIYLVTSNTYNSNNIEKYLLKINDSNFVKKFRHKIECIMSTIQLKYEEMYPDAEPTLKKRKTTIWFDKPNL